MAVEKHIDMKTYLKTLDRVVRQTVAADVKNRARKNVRKDTFRLMNTIRVEGTTENIRTIAQTPYALAQEYGRPDLPQYTFNPYMRPAAAAAALGPNIKAAAETAHDAAMRAAKR